MAVIKGTITIKVTFSDLFADDDSESAVLDAIFPDGWEGELDVTDIDVDIEDDDD